MHKHLKYCVLQFVGLVLLALVHFQMNAQERTDVDTLYSPLKIDAGGLVHICFDDISQENGIRIADDLWVYGGALPYSFRWYIAGESSFRASEFLADTSAANPLIVGAPLEYTTFVVEVTDAEGVVDRDSLKITTSRWITPEGSFDSQTIPKGENCLLNGLLRSTAEPISYQWSPSKYFSVDTIPNPIVRPIRDMKFHVKSTDTHGCVREKDFLVFVRSREEILLQGNLFIVYVDRMEKELNICLDEAALEGMLTIRNDKGLEMERLPADEKNLVLDLANYPDGFYEVFWKGVNSFSSQHFYWDDL